MVKRFFCVPALLVLVFFLLVPTSAHASYFSDLLKKYTQPESKIKNIPIKLTCKVTNWNTGKPFAGAKVELDVLYVAFGAKASGFTDKDGNVTLIISSHPKGTSYLLNNLYFLKASSKNYSSRTWRDRLRDTQTIALSLKPLDQTPPVGTIKINNDAAYARSTSVWLNLNAKDSTENNGSGITTQVRFSEDNKNWSASESWRSYTMPWKSPVGDGPKIVYVKFMDSVGNWSLPVSDSIILDATPPVINITYPTENFLTNQKTITVKYTVDGEPKTLAYGSLSEGMNVLQVAARDTAGNNTLTGVKVFVDTKPPVIIIISPKDGYLTNQKTVTLNYTVDGEAKSEERALTEGLNMLTASASDPAGNNGSASVKVTLDTIAPKIIITEPANNFLTNKLKITLQGTVDGEAFSEERDLPQEGANILTKTATDSAGNSSSQSITVMRDTIAPTGSIRLKDNPAYVSSPWVSLINFAQDNAGGSGIDKMRFSGDEKDWSESEPYSENKEFKLSSGDGRKTIYAQFSDKAGNRSTSASYIVILDVSASSKPVVIDEGKETISLDRLKASWSSADDVSGIAEYQYRLTRDSASGEAIVGWTSSGIVSQINLTGLTLEPNKTYYFSVKAKNNAGLWSEVGCSDGIATVIPDTTAPVGSIKINSDEEYTNSADVTLNLFAQDNEKGSGIAKMRFSNDEITYSALEDYSVVKPWKLSSGDDEKKVWVKFQDFAGNESESFSDTIILDTTLPIINIVSPENNFLTNQKTITLNYTVDGAAKSEERVLTEGLNTLIASTADQAGNNVSASVKVTLDTAAPEVIITEPVDNFLTNKSKVIFKGTVDGEAFSEERDLPEEGLNILTKIATDSVGNSSSRSITVIRDTVGLNIIITSPKDKSYVNQSSILLEGTVDGEAFFEERVLTQDIEDPFLGGAENVITKSVTDASGNTSSASVTIYYYTGKLIGREGGEVSSPDGKLKLIIPPDALTEPKPISISSVDIDSLKDISIPKDTSLLAIAECLPKGLVFQKEVDVIYILDQAEIPGTSVELGLYDRLQNKIISVGHNTTVPTDGYTITCHINHFSTYAALKGFISQGAPIGAGVKVPLPDMFTGSFSHAIPITVPPGRKGIQPSLGLSYRSSNGNSWVGVGYSLNPGQITRSTKLGPPSYDDKQDTFYFISDSGTTELVHLTDNLYQSKIESSFTKFFKESDDSWRALSKDGSVMLFGKTTESKEGSPKGTFSWYLTKAQDTNGNYLKVSYTKDQGKSYLLKIDYTGNENVGFSPTNSVEFFLEDREDIASSYITTSKIATTKRLKEIQTKVGSDLVWRYKFEYTYSPDTNRSLLTKATQYAADDKNLPVQTFKYQKASETK